MNSDNRFDVLAHGLDRLSIDEDLKSKIDRLSELPLDQVFQLKSQVEQELSRFFDLLSESNVDMDTQLITPEGFPRSDIDVLQVRLIRRSVNMLRNDLSKIIERSNSLMAKHFEKLEVKNHVVTQHGAPIESRIPFALVTEVFDSSPSHRGVCTLKETFDANKKRFQSSIFFSSFFFPLSCLLTNLFFFFSYREYKTMTK